MTEDVKEESYSSVVLLDNVRLLFIVAQLFGLQVVTADVSHAYVNAYTQEKVYSIAGPEFGENAGKPFIVEKALYGLRTSGVPWHDHASDTLRILEFKRCKAGNDIWMRDMGDHYEFITIFVNDLIIFSKNPGALIESIEAVYQLKGVGKPDYYNGGDIHHDEEGRHCFSAKN